MVDISAAPETEIDPYVILGVASTASSADVKAAYRSLALKNHPGELNIGKSTSEIFSLYVSDLEYRQST